MREIATRGRHVDVVTSSTFDLNFKLQNPLFIRKLRIVDEENGSVKPRIDSKLTVEQVEIFRNSINPVELEGLIGKLLPGLKIMTVKLSD